jgi:enamine deaminase RidA (YjgF/YER057c/UK114 family)
MRPLAPSSLHPPFANYSHGVEARVHRLVLTSGQLGIALDGTVPPTVAEQARICLSAIDAILAEAGLGRRHVLKLNAFVTDRNHMAGYMAARDEWLAAETHKPASTLMIVAGFTRPEFLVEIEAIAAEEV